MSHTPDGLRPETLRALMDHVPVGDGIDFFDVGDDPFAYGRRLAQLWSEDNDLAVIEQDVVIRADVAVAFTSCEAWYCSFPYAWTTTVGPALGCTRFRAEFLAEYPDAMERALLEPGGYGPGHFRSVDVALMRYVLARDGVQPHVHLPAVEHLNESQALIEGADPTPVTEVPVW